MLNPKVILCVSILITLFIPLTKNSSSPLAAQSHPSSSSFKIKLPSKDAKEEKDFQVFLENPVMVFSRPGCPYSSAAKSMLTETLTTEPAPVIVEVTEFTYINELRSWLSSVSDVSTLPNIFFGGHSIGGYDDLQKLYRENEVQGELDRWTYNQVKVVPIQQA
ncbi:monothiol glutaredoxin Grx3 [Schizosaccharomyces cryophilus OY26]|uniref:Monothiol glutaredoxin Grx3 n=1 Tax=Schizosaccharomyces cryophilus (strain OY26 / ATCC MYA-4695 / CBS 11777 / NBRC 106824 / NRRL Y48691) TaxID=653667 RepID=S9VWI5_SCHCR|nr:monothiol glutaredoxin Grx3 [Schizosaccharomyces cryophilus OY26]EPY52013.1 monothiol glutaredoxin Grx3 [Schizosaccharomyces cryophilus OY26]